MTKTTTINGQPLSREDLIYLWKVEGGNYSWAQWAKMHDIPAHDPAFIEQLKQFTEGSKGKE